MKNEIKELWIKALESGEFRQGRGRLEKNGKYCALGVLSALAMVEGVCTYNELPDGGRFDNRKYGLSYNVLTWAGLDLDDAYVQIKVGSRETTVADLNDAGKNFKLIAKILRRLPFPA